MFRLPSNAFAAAVTIVFWWPLAAVAVMAYWVYIGWWWRLL